MEAFLLSGCQKTSEGRKDTLLIRGQCFTGGCSSSPTTTADLIYIFHKNFHASIVCAFFTNDEAKDDVKMLNGRYAQCTVRDFFNIRTGVAFW